jgi:hypothetical protein
MHPWPDPALGHDQNSAAGSKKCFSSVCEKRVKEREVAVMRVSERERDVIFF